MKQFTDGYACDALKQCGEMSSTKAFPELSLRSSGSSCNKVQMDQTTTPPPDRSKPGQGDEKTPPIWGSYAKECAARDTKF